MPAPPVIADLVERFEQQGDAYKSGHYNEAQLRKEFIDPMFEALGWDMENISGYAEAYKDVIHEDAIKIGGATRRQITAFASAARGSSFSKRRNHRSISRPMRIQPINFGDTHGRQNCRLAS